MSETASAPCVLVVDDDPRACEIISELLLSEGYRTATAPNAEAALSKMAAGIDLVLSDMKMPGYDGVWLLEQARERCPHIPFILLTGCADTEGAIDALRRGAADYLLKPPRMLDMVRAIERALAKQRVEEARTRYQLGLEQRVLEKTAELRRALEETERAYDSTLLGLVAALDARERETKDHSQRVVRYAAAIGRRLALDDRALYDLSRGALLHDIGKIGVSDAILLRRGPLDEAEWAEMRKHPEIGAAILKSIPSLAIPSEVVLFHHERFDGTGYPHGLAGEAIPLGARIFAVADAFDAITSDRPYRKSQPVSEARKEIARNAGSQFDPEVSRAFETFSDSELRELIDELEVCLTPTRAA